MHPERKLNTNIGRNETVLWMVLGPLLVTLVFLLGLSIALFAPICLVYSLLSLLLYVRTLNTGYIVKSLMFFFLAVFFVLVLFRGYDIITFFFGAVSLLFVIWLFILIGIRDYKWRTTELLELAAMPVNKIEEGYSMRPMPAGKVEYQWSEMLRFSKFIRRNLISVPYHEKGKVIFSLNRSRLKLISFSSNYIKDSWVAFDQLCNSLGVLYSEFLRLFQEDNEAEIIKRIDFIRI